MALISRKNEIPPSLTSRRSIMVLNASDDVWEEITARCQNHFRPMGVDIVAHIRYRDFTSGEAVRRWWMEYLKRRKIHNIFFLNYSEQFTELAVAPLDTSKFLSAGTAGWYVQDQGLFDAVFRFALDLKKSQSKTTNFLILAKPEWVVPPPLGKRNFKNFPSRLRQIPLAVSLFDTLDTTGVGPADLDVLARVQDHNDSVHKRNDVLREVMSDYPYDFEFLYPKANKDLYDEGFTYVLRSVRSVPDQLCDMLGYEQQDMEKMEGIRTMLRQQDSLISVGEPAPVIHKFYLRHTSNLDIHVGKQWDGEVDWKESMQKFISEMKAFLEQK